MKQIFVIIFFFFFRLNSFSQSFHVDAGLGVVAYNGDLQLQKIKPNTFLPAFTVGMGYQINSHIGINGNILYGKLKGDDKKAIKPQLVARNLNFTSELVEGNLLLEYHLFSTDVPPLINPFIYAGIGVYHFNPYTFDSVGGKVFLQPLGTEGQGLPQYPDRKKYSLNQFNIPFGGGIRYRINNHVTLSAEVSFRKLFTDYLDDVSMSYPDSLLLLKARGPLAVKYSFRKNELDPTARWPTDGNRGNATRNDTYYFVLFKLSFTLPQGNHLFKNGVVKSRKSKVSCPDKVL
ncbi:MAG: outer membrane beta-barrel protein [Bacteroidetes bacterium]|nr:outer membrane beta-barrel protein [Bacteroidota bacterium]